jgi:hypothetical protein
LYASSSKGVYLPCQKFSAQSADTAGFQEWNCATT